MNRIFHPKVGWTLYFVLIVLASQMFYFFWIKQIIVAILIALLELFLIEMIIHTQYIVTDDGVLKLNLGRFFPSSSIPVKDIISLEQSHSWETSAALSYDRIQIKYRGKFQDEKVHVSPVKRREFVELLIKMNNEIAVSDELKK